jgi:hypothetical protein
VLVEAPPLAPLSLRLALTLPPAAGGAAAAPSSSRLLAPLAPATLLQSTRLRLAVETPGSEVLGELAPLLLPAAAHAATDAPPTALLTLRLAGGALAEAARYANLSAGMLPRSAALFIHVASLRPLPAGALALSLGRVGAEGTAAGEAAAGEAGGAHVLSVASAASDAADDGEGAVQHTLAAGVVLGRWPSLLASLPHVTLALPAAFVGHAELAVSLFVEPALPAAAAATRDAIREMESAAMDGSAVNEATLARWAAAWDAGADAAAEALAALRVSPRNHAPRLALAGAADRNASTPSSWRIMEDEAAPLPRLASLAEAPEDAGVAALVGGRALAPQPPLLTLALAASALALAPPPAAGNGSVAPPLPAAILLAPSVCFAAEVGGALAALPPGIRVVQAPTGACAHAAGAAPLVLGRAARADAGAAASIALVGGARLAPPPPAEWLVVSGEAGALAELWGRLVLAPGHVGARTAAPRSLADGAAADASAVASDDVHGALWALLVDEGVRGADEPADGAPLAAGAARAWSLRRVNHPPRFRMPPPSAIAAAARSAAGMGARANFSIALRGAAAIRVEDDDAGAGALSLEIAAFAGSFAIRAEDDAGRALAVRIEDVTAELAAAAGSGAGAEWLGASPPRAGAGAEWLGASPPRAALRLSGSPSELNAALASLL